jgi:CheY-like chemotaxis protein
MKNKKILIVDDDKDILNSLELFLTAEGYTVNTANSGKEALKILKKENFDLITMDVLMPGMNGLELASLIRETTSLANIKIVFFTVVENAGEEIKEKLKGIKPVRWLRKPVDINVLRGALKDIFKTRPKVTSEKKVVNG